MLTDEKRCTFITEEMWNKDMATGKRLSNVVQGKLHKSVKEKLGIND